MNYGNVPSLRSVCLAIRDSMPWVGKKYACAEIERRQAKSDATV